MDKDKIEVTGEDNKISVSHAKEIEIKGNDNIIKIDAGKKDVEIKGDGNIIESPYEKISLKERIAKVEIKKKAIKTFEFIKQKKVINILIILAFLFLLIGSMWIRTQNLSLLKDSTSGKTIPLALDPYYFLRLAETMVETGGDLPEFDKMRAPALNTPWIPEILPNVVVGMYKITKIFNSDINVRDIHILSPVIFFVISLIIFYFLASFLIKSKPGALLASALLAFSPAYLYRTMAGFADHDALGMVFLFACFLVLSIGLKRFKKNWKETIFWGALLSFFTILTLVSWGGAITFLLLVVPTSFLIYYLLNSKDQLKILVFYLVWLIGNLIFPVFFGYPWNVMIAKFLGSYGLIVPFVFVFFIIDQGLNYLKENKSYFKGKYEKLYSFAITLILGLVSLIFLGKNPINVMREIWFKLMRPFASATGRLGLTVAENAQPYLVNWMNQMGKNIFWLFFVGIILIGIEFSKGIKGMKYKIWFNLFWIFFVSSILFSRISSSSVFNGANFISQAFYLAGLIGFGGYFAYIYTKTKFNVDLKSILFLPLIIFTLIYGRSASRIFFLITPFAFLVIGNLVVGSFNYFLKTKEEILKLFIGFIFITALIVSLMSIGSNYLTIQNQAKYTGPSANQQWQSAMGWARNNTQEGEIFVHWWDYGYWVQTLGERPTVTDGGHAAGDAGDHYIGRYILTTPEPKSALSFMKTWNVSYLLIDQTDLGKYPAYSKIGSNNELDRFSVIPTMILDEKQVYETANLTTMVYLGTTGVDEDIDYNQGENSIFLPGPTYDDLGEVSYKSFVIGTIIKTKATTTGLNFEQPQVVYNYNGKQTILPVRYIYFNGQIFDFNSGIESIIRFVPLFDGQKANQLGSVIYLSQKVQKSLFSRIYLLDNVFGDYNSLELVHSEDDGVVKSLKNGGLDLGDLVYYQGLRGPIKIWKVNYPEDVKEEKGFIKTYRPEYGDLDYLFY